MKERNSNLKNSLVEIYQELYEIYSDNNCYHVHWFGTRDLVKLNDIAEVPISIPKAPSELLALIQSKIDEKIKNTSIVKELDQLRSHFQNVDLKVETFFDDDNLLAFCKLIDKVDKIHLQILNDLRAHHLNIVESHIEFIDKFSISLARLIKWRYDNNDLFRHLKNYGTSNHVNVRKIHNEINRINHITDKQEQIKERRIIVSLERDQEQSIIYLESRITAVNEKLLDPNDVYENIYLWLLTKKYRRYLFNTEAHAKVYEKEFIEPHLSSVTIGSGIGKTYNPTDNLALKNIIFSDSLMPNFSYANFFYEELSSPIVLAIDFIMSLKLSVASGFQDIDMVSLKTHPLSIRNLDVFEYVSSHNSLFVFLCDAILKKLLLFENNLSKILRIAHAKEAIKKEQNIFIQKKVSEIKGIIKSPSKKLIVFRGGKLSKGVSDKVASVILDMLSNFEELKSDTTWYDQGVALADVSKKVNGKTRIFKPIPKIESCKYKLFFDEERHGKTLKEVLKALFNHTVRGRKIMTENELDLFIAIYFSTTKKDDPILNEVPIFEYYRFSGFYSAIYNLLHRIRSVYFLNDEPLERFAFIVLTAFPKDRRVPIIITQRILDIRVSNMSTPGSIILSMG